jgi:hypothetical protein
MNNKNFRVNTTFFVKIDNHLSDFVDCISKIDTHYNYDAYCYYSTKYNTSSQRCLDIFIPSQWLPNFDSHKNYVKKSRKNAKNNPNPVLYSVTFVNFRWHRDVFIDVLEDSNCVIVLKAKHPMRHIRANEVNTKH